MPRGACPTLAEPMPVADGLLARFRPISGLSSAQLHGLADAAETFGNGRLEVTARGSMQIRGLSNATVQGFREALDEVGIVARTGVAVEVSPIAGEDPKEVRDPRALASALELVCAAALAKGALSPKLTIVLVTGGQVLLDGLRGDIRLLAQSEDWVLEVGGETIGAIAEADIPDTVAEILARLQAIGPRARGGDLSGAELAARLSSVEPLPLTFTRPANPALGPLSLLDGRPALRIGLAFGQAKPAQLHALADAMTDHGVSEARPGPDRSLVLTGFEPAALRSLSPALAANGFWTRHDPRDPDLRLCSGAEAGPDGVIHAADLAQALVGAAPDIVDGSFHIHVSTCAKGCAHTGRPGLVLKANGLEVYRGATQKPFATLDPAAIETGLVHLAARIRDIARPGETTLDCMSRLGAQ